jgi:hypothetical protein
MNNLTQAPPLFTDYSLTELKSVKHELKESIRLAVKHGRFLILKPVLESNLRKVNEVLNQRSLKAESI